MFWKQAWGALGKTAPAINSGYWWSSCQRSAADAVGLYYGAVINLTKSNIRSLLVGFDL